MHANFDAIGLPPADRDLVTPCPPRTPRVDVDIPLDDTHADESRSLVMAVARAAVEALSGYRPLAQLSRWLAPSALEGLDLARRHRDWRGTGVTRVWANQILPGVIEGVAQIRLHDHRVALPIRLEYRAGRWVCTHLGVLLPGSHMRA